MISYQPFYETLLRENITEYALIFKHGIPANTLNNLRHNEPPVRREWFFRNYPLLLLYPMYLNFASSNCLPHLPYIVRFIIFNLLLVPSTNPLL